MIGPRVESAEVWQRLASLGCELAQGYYLGRPMPAEEIGGWLARHADSLRGQESAPQL